MFRLLEILIYTPDLKRLRDFYERVVGLSTRTASDTWTAYDTSGALLALRPTPAGQPGHVELTFMTDDLAAATRGLRARGATIAGEIQIHGWGRLLRFRDPDGNALALAEPEQPFEEGDGLALGTAIVNTREIAAAKSFYHHVMGLRVSQDSPYWTEFDTGPTRLALHPRASRQRPYARPLAFGFAIPGLIDWAEKARARGLRFATVPRDEDWGLFSDAVDPDGNEVTFFERARPLELEEELAEGFEDDGVRPQAGMRKPLKKRSKAASRVAVRPDYKARDSGRRRRPSATTTSVASVRGGGPERTRLKPRRTGDEKKAKTKPAQGRLRKAKDATLAQKKKAVARASKGKPVKRAAPRSKRAR
jgi:predicted enzyme related to lactoylglutathione lyase